MKKKTEKIKGMEIHTHNAFTDAIKGRLELTKITVKWPAPDLHENEATVNNLCRSKKQISHQIK